MIPTLALLGNIPPTSRHLIEPQILVSQLILTFCCSSLNLLSISFVPPCINNPNELCCWKSLLHTSLSICFLWRYLTCKGAEKIANTVEFRLLRRLDNSLIVASFICRSSDTIWISILISLLAVTMPSPQSLLSFICRLQNKLFYLWFIIKPRCYKKSLPVHYHLFQSLPENLKVVQVNYYCDIEIPDNSYKKL